MEAFPKLEARVDENGILTDAMMDAELDFLKATTPKRNKKAKDEVSDISRQELPHMEMNLS